MGRGARRQEFPGGPRAEGGVTRELRSRARDPARAHRSYKSDSGGPRAEGGDTKEIPRGVTTGRARRGEIQKNTRESYEGPRAERGDTKKIRNRARAEGGDTKKYQTNTNRRAWDLEIQKKYDGARHPEIHKKYKKDTIPPGEPWGLSAWGHASPRLAVPGLAVWGWLSGAG